MDNKAHAVLTVLFARAMQARFMPTRLTNSINHRCLVVFALSGNLHSMRPLNLRPYFTNSSVV